MMGLFCDLSDYKLQINIFRERRRMILKISLIFYLIPPAFFPSMNLIPRPLLLKEKGSKNLIFSSLSPSPSGEGFRVR
jgi:hypothetical protein